MNKKVSFIAGIAVCLMAASPVFCQEEMLADSPEVQDESLICDQCPKASGNGHQSCSPVEPICQPYVCKPQKCGSIQDPQSPTMPAYNAPAEINIGMTGDWNFFSTVSFLYWQPTQENMSVATVNSQPITTLINPTSYDRAEVIDMSFGFKPAFKIALGMNFGNDDWVGYAEYTRVHGSNHVSGGVSPSIPTVYNLWGNDPLATTFAGTAVFNNYSAGFDCNLDFIDAEIERVYFVGKRLTFHSAFGLRWAVISESLHASYSYNGAFLNNTNAKVVALPGTLDAYLRTRCWGIGPRFGMEMDWLIRHGIRIFGSGFADILYTSYKIQTKSATLPNSSALTPFLTGNPVIEITRDDSLGTLRTHLDCELGVGWGRYLDYYNWHMDFSLAYGFQVFFNQNMLRFPVASPSNLYIQGLTFAARLDY